MRVTTKERLFDWLDKLAESSQLIAPKASENQILYKPVTDSSEVVWDFVRSDLSAKEHFLPSTHVLLSIKSDEQTLTMDEPSLEEERILFGLRPCDARALRVLDALFLDQEPIDPYYAQRRDNTVLVGLACREMGDECFCTSFSLAPDETSDVDLMLTEMEEGYAVEVVSEKGMAVLGDLTVDEIEEHPPEPIAHGEAIPIPEVETWPQYFDHTFWARLSDRCLSCRICAYVCPTCRCFDVRDYATGVRSIERLSAWDSCMAEGYRRIAGGDNPRPTKTQRLRNRFYCKFYYYAQDFGSVACVGCGRCISKCPANVDLAEVLEQLAEL